MTQSNLMTSHLKELKLALQVNDSKVSHLEAQNGNLLRANNQNVNIIREYQLKLKEV